MFKTQVLTEVKKADVLMARAEDRIEMMLVLKRRIEGLTAKKLEVLEAFGRESDLSKDLTRMIEDLEDALYIARI